jgi:hypothetical protein
MPCPCSGGARPAAPTPTQIVSANHQNQNKKIRQLQYGANGTWRDITAHVARSLAAGASSQDLHISNERLAGDPLVGIVKACRVVFDDGSHFDVTEGSSWRLNQTEIEQVRALL